MERFRLVFISIVLTGTSCTDIAVEEQDSGKQVAGTYVNDYWCGKNCLNVMISKMENAIDGYGFGTNFSPQIHDRTVFNSVCSSYAELQKCFSLCTASTYSMNKQKSLFQPLEYLCVKKYNDFVQAMECYETFHTQVDRVCTEKCGNSDQYKLAFYGRLESKEIEQYFHNWCKYTACQHHCQIPIYNKGCGSEKPGLIQGQFIQESIMSTKSLMRHSGRGHLYPDSYCNKLMNISHIIREKKIIKIRKNTGKKRNNGTNQNCPAWIFVFVLFLVFDMYKAL